jgi:hypothetical protein
MQDSNARVPQGNLLARCIGVNGTSTSASSCSRYLLQPLSPAPRRRTDDRHARACRSPCESCIFLSLANATLRRYIRSAPGSIDRAFDRPRECRIRRDTMRSPGRRSKGLKIHSGQLLFARATGAADFRSISGRNAIQEAVQSAAMPRLALRSKDSSAAWVPRRRKTAADKTPRTFVHGQHGGRRRDESSVERVQELRHPRLWPAAYSFAGRASRITTSFERARNQQFHHASQGSTPFGRPKKS